MKVEIKDEDVIPFVAEERGDESIDLFAIAVTVLREWRLGLITFVLVSALAIAVVFYIKPQYVATASILPHQHSTESSTLSALMGVSTSGAGSLYPGLLRSRSVQDRVIDDLHLLQIFHTTSYEDARNDLAGKSTFADGPDGILRISVRDGSARDAAAIANEYLKALQALNSRMAVAQSKEMQEFFQGQLSDERNALNESEEKLANTQEKTGLIQPEAQTGIGLSAIASTRQQITSLEVQLAAMLQSETQENPQVQRVESQIAQLKTQEAMLERGGKTPVGAAPSAVQAPTSNMDYIRAQRAVQYHSTLVTSLATQYENAQLSEGLGRSSFQVIDYAIPPEHKEWPPRKAYTLFSLIAGVFFGIVAIVCKLMMRRILADPEHREQMRQLRSVFGGGSTPGR